MCFSLPLVMLTGAAFEIITADIGCGALQGINSTHSHSHFIIVQAKTTDNKFIVVVKSRAILQRIGGFLSLEFGGLKHREYYLLLTGLLIGFEIGIFKKSESR